MEYYIVCAIVGHFDRTICARATFTTEAEARTYVHKTQGTYKENLIILKALSALSNMGGENGT